jgi:RNA polymerase sigma-70 factor (ECF subfamily)
MNESSAFTAVLGPIAMKAERRSTDHTIAEPRLIRSAQRGDPRALEELARTHWRAAWATAYGIIGDPISAEDIAQEAVLKAIRSLDRFDRKRPFAPWLHGIVANRALDWVRAHRVRATLSTHQPPDLVAAPAPDGLSRDLIDALQLLEERDRAIVVLRHVAGFSSPEIAEIVEMSRTAVRSALKRALEQLREHLSLESGAVALTAEAEEER